MDKIALTFSYTWAHTIADASSDANYVLVRPGDSTSERGSSDYDIRQTFSAATSYKISGAGQNLEIDIWELVDRFESFTLEPRSR